MVHSGMVLGGMFSFSMWAEAVVLLLPFPSISFICSWRLEGTGFLPDRRPSVDDDVPTTKVSESEDRGA